MLCLQHVLIDLIQVVLNLVDFGVMGIMDIGWSDFFNFDVALLLMNLLDDYFGVVDEDPRLLK